MNDRQTFGDELGAWSLLWSLEPGGCCPGSGPESRSHFCGWTTCGLHRWSLAKAAPACGSLGPESQLTCIGTDPICKSWEAVGPICNLRVPQAPTLWPNKPASQESIPDATLSTSLPPCKPLSSRLKPTRGLQARSSFVSMEGKTRAWQEHGSQAILPLLLRLLLRGNPLPDSKYCHGRSGTPKHPRSAAHGMTTTSPQSNPSTFPA